MVDDKPDAVPTKEEWIEIYNPTDQISPLKGWSLVEGNHTFVFSEEQILPYEYLVIAHSLSSFTNLYGIEASFGWSSMALNNSGDTIFLRDNEQKIIDEVTYTNNSAKEGSSVERLPRGDDSDDFSQDFIEQQFPSPFAGILGNINLDINNVSENFIELFWDKNFGEDFEEFILYKSTDGKVWSESVISGQKETNFKVDSLESGVRYYFKIRVLSFRNDFWDSNIVSATTKKQYSKNIIVNELLPHPSTGVNDEYIELYNQSNEDVDLAGWILEDLGGKQYIIPKNAESIMSANSYKIFYKSVTKISLNDDGDSINLLWPDGSLCSDSQEYKNAGYNMSWSRNADGGWIFSTTATPEAVNIFTTKKDEVKNIPIIPVKEAKKRVKNEWVRVEGVVTALPGLFGRRVMYIQDESGGVKIYFDKALWPELKIGDRVIIYGKISISAGEHQIRVYSPYDIIITGHDPPLEPKKLIISQASGFIGCLVRISGRVIKISGSTIWIDDGTGELRIYFYSATGIKKLGLKKGDWVIIVGILSKTKAGLRLLPRSKEDIKIIKQSKEEAKAAEDINPAAQILGVEKAYAASDYRTNPQPAEIKKKISYLWGGILFSLGLLSLASLMIFAKIRKKYAKDNQFF
jgi:DNA/RNA endonuclease YhcR with UshA esterase domain